MKDLHPGDDRLIAYALDELEGPERSNIEAHLHGCGVCRSVIASLAGALEAFRASPGTDPPADVLVELVEAQTSARERRSLGRWVFGPAAAMAVAVLLAAVFLAGFLSGRYTAPVSGPVSPGGARNAVIGHPLPEPPHIPFQAAPVAERESI